LFVLKPQYLRNLEELWPSPNRYLAFPVALQALPIEFLPRRTAVMHELNAVHDGTCSAKDMARSLLFKERTAGVPERLPPYRIPEHSEKHPGENRGFPALGLLSLPRPIRLTQTTNRINVSDDPRLTSPHLPPASTSGTFGVTARARLIGFCNPHFFSFQRRAPIVSHCYRLPFKAEAEASTTGEPLAVFTTRRFASGGPLRC
jgi:hypothetical protein